MLNLFTLRIKNKQVALSFEKHQAQKLDRLLWGGVITASSYLVWSCLSAFSYNTGPGVSVACNAIMLSLVFAFKIFRQKTNNTKFHEYIVILVLAVHITLCTLTNTNKLPEKLMGPGLD